MTSPRALTDDGTRSAGVLLRRASLRVTPQRDAVLGVLLARPDHLTASAIHDQLRTGPLATTLSTVHRTLGGLADRGLLHSVPTHAGTAYGVSHRAHGHITCRRCACTVDLDADPGALAAGMALCGFAADAVEVVLTSVCAACGASVS